MSGYSGTPLAQKLGIRAEALPLSLVDIKVCAIDEVWSGLKLVLRKSPRPAAAPRARARRRAGTA